MNDFQIEKLPEVDKWLVSAKRKNCEHSQWTVIAHVHEPTSINPIVEMVKPFGLNGMGELVNYLKGK